MRIARVLTRLNLGGPARQVLASDPILASRGHELCILAGRPEPGEGDLFDELVGRGLDVVRVPGLRRGISPVRDLVAQRAIHRTLAGFRPDVLHTHASKAGTLGRRALGTRRAFDAVGRLHTFHGHVLEGYFPPVVSRRLVALERRLARATDRILAVSHATADDLVRLEVVAEDKLCVVAPGIELGALLEIPRTAERAETGPVRRLCGAGPEAVLVGVVGRLAAVKEPLLAIEVFELLAGRYPELQLVFVGDGSERRALEARIAGLGQLAGRVHLLGAVSDMPPVLAELDLLLATSRSEGMPVALIEGAAAGLPAVATPVGGVSEVVVHERTGWLAEQPSDLAFGLGHLLEHPHERLAMGQRARLRVAKRHSAETLADRLEELYRIVHRERSAEARP